MTSPPKKFKEQIESNLANAKRLIYCVNRSQILWKIFFLRE